MLDLPLLLFRCCSSTHATNILWWISLPVIERWRDCLRSQSSNSWSVEGTALKVPGAQNVLVVSSCQLLYWNHRGVSPDLIQHEVTRDVRVLVHIESLSIEDPGKGYQWQLSRPHLLLSESVSTLLPSSFSSYLTYALRKGVILATWDCASCQMGL